jgi:plastocyanin
MRFYGLAFVAGAFLVGACGGGEKKADSTATTTPAPDTAAPAMAAPTTGTVAAAPITGTIHEVKMIGDAQGYRFEPANITAKSGDGIKFIAVSIPPHNVAFDAATVPADSRDQLFANMPNASAPGSSPLLMNPNETWTLSMGNIKPG